MSIRYYFLVFFEKLTYRFRQLSRDFYQSSTKKCRSELIALMSEGEALLFFQQTQRDQNHAVRTAFHVKQLCVNNQVDPPRFLVIAALLHDIGKGEVKLIDRVVFVICNFLSSTLSRKIASNKTNNWRATYWRLKYHAIIGADLLKQVDSDPRVIDLVRRHHCTVAGNDNWHEYLVHADYIA